MGVVSTLKALIVATSAYLQPPSIDAAYCMARVVWGEARGDFVQMQHVAHVLWNRAGKDQRNVCKEARKPRQFAGYRTVPRDDLDWRYAGEIAIRVQAGLSYDTSQGSTHFVDHTRSRPRWIADMDVVGYRGNHVYMREKE